MKINSGKSNKILYFFTPFLLIPIVGGCLGVIFILRSIFYFKDRFLLISGCIGIVITVTYAAFFGFNFKGGNRMDKAMVVLSIKHLDDITGYLEVYKKKYYSYPDSLSELKKMSGTINLSDPVANLKSGRITQYNYKKDGESYVLFSSGLDTIPGTSDDLYSNFK